MIVPALLLGGAVVAAARGKRLPAGPVGRGVLVAFAIVLAGAERLRADGQPRDRRRVGGQRDESLRGDRRRPARHRPHAVERPHVGGAGRHVHQRRRPGQRPRGLRPRARAGADRLPPLVRVGRRRGSGRRGGRVRQGARAEPAPEGGRRHRAVRSRPSSHRWTAPDGPPGPAREPGGGRAPRLRVRRVPARRRRRGRGRHVGDHRAGAAVPVLVRLGQGRSGGVAGRHRAAHHRRALPASGPGRGRSRRCRSGRTPTMRSRIAPSSASRWPRRSAGSTRASAS